ncbi:pectate lyase [Povalibacter uvarum]|uniref:Pectate lyase n=1 Tax=Povalibacter uvarum TaxID=732238 RepID=A0A841HJQ0_9GAMM|nr:polysaccharide lyase family 1 protein [Povalibacter uvarum]MBB6092530.1 pectate lyase [Povalibacter uvarum]
MPTTKNYLRTVCVFAAAMAAPVHSDPSCDLGRLTLDPTDGWAAAGTGVTGGSAAVPSQVYTVTTRAELIAALNNGVTSSTSPSNPSNEPKIIYVKGTIDFNVDDANNPLTCVDYYRNGYTLESFLATYDPAVWGRVNPVGLLETARVASQQAQQARVRIRVGSNTTIVGIDKYAVIRGAWFDLRGTANVFNSRSNIIIRNITFQDTYDCFPAWSPTDGSQGSWNAQYDSISLRDTNNVWIDHNTFEDKATQDQDQPHHFGVLYQVHDGLLDITNASDLVTVSWNRFRNHDKMMLIGSSDSATADRGKLRVTLHHNLFDGIGQRAPRVRYGQVHIYNNYYKIERLPNYQYSWGVGIESSIVAESNFFKTDKTVTPDQFIGRFNGTQIYAEGNQLNGTPVKNVFDPVAAWNAVNDPDLVPTVEWLPVFISGYELTKYVPASVQNDAGPFNW